jgi:hypothetical protein
VVLLVDEFLHLRSEGHVGEEKPAVLVVVAVLLVCATEWDASYIWNSLSSSKGSIISLILTNQRIIHTLKSNHHSTTHPTTTALCTVFPPLPPLLLPLRSPDTPFLLKVASSNCRFWPGRTPIAVRQFQSPKTSNSLSGDFPGDPCFLCSFPSDFSKEAAIYIYRER